MANVRMASDAARRAAECSAAERGRTSGVSAAAGAAEDAGV